MFSAQLSSLEIVSIGLFTTVFILAGVMLVFGKNVRHKVVALLTVAYFSNPVWVGRFKSGLFREGPNVSQSMFVGTIVFMLLACAVQFNRKSKDTYDWISLHDFLMFLWCAVMFSVSIYAFAAGDGFSYSYAMLGVVLYFIITKTVLVEINHADLLDGLEIFALLYFAICWVYSIIYLEHHGGILGGRLQTITKATEDIGVYSSLFLILVAAFRDWTRLGRSQVVLATGFITLLASGNRASFILFLISFIMIYMARIKKGNVFVKLIVPVALLITVICGSIDNNKMNYGKAKSISITSSIDRIKGDGMSLSSSNRMMTIWPMYLKSISENPFGVKGYPTSHDMPKNIYPHNLFLYVLYAGGLLAGILFSVWMAVACLTFFIGSSNVLISTALIVTFLGNIMKFDPIRTPNEFAFYIGVSMLCVRIAYSCHQAVEDSLPYPAPIS